MKELGYDVEYYLWVGLFAIKGTPANVIATLSSAIDKAAHSDAFKGIVAKLGQDYNYLNAKEFATFWDKDAKQVEEAVKSIGRVNG